MFLNNKRIQDFENYNLLQVYQSVDYKVKVELKALRPCSQITLFFVATRLRQRDR